MEILYQLAFSPYWCSLDSGSWSLDTGAHAGGGSIVHGWGEINLRDHHRPRASPGLLWGSGGRHHGRSWRGGERSGQLGAGVHHVILSWGLGGATGGPPWPATSWARHYYRFSLWNSNIITISLHKIETQALLYKFHNIEHVRDISSSTLTDCLQSRWKLFCVNLAPKSLSCSERESEPGQRLDRLLVPTGRQ